MNKLPVAKRAQILSILCEGSSLRSTARVTDVAINSVIKLMIEAGKACSAFHDENVRGVKSKRIQCDEIWAYCYSKQKNVATAKSAPDGAGDVWTWTAIDADTKLIVSYLSGGRDADYALALMDDLRSRLVNRVQLTTDGLKSYLVAVEEAFGDDIDYAQLVKLYGDAPEAMKGKYSPAECTGIKKTPITGNPDKKHVSTSYVERANLTMRMCNRRFTRLTNAFSKKLENHCHMIYLYATWFNFVRIHKTLRVTPAMAAGLTGTLWGMEDLVAMIDARAEAPKRPATYRKKDISK